MTMLLHGNEAHKLTNEERSRAGQSTSPKKKYAAQIRELKKKALNDESIRKLISLVDDPDASAIDIVTTLKVAESKATTSKEMSLLASVKTRFYMARFGQLIKSQRTSLNVDVVSYADIADIYRAVKEERAKLKETVGDASGSS